MGGGRSAVASDHYGHTTAPRRALQGHSYEDVLGGTSTTGPNEALFFEIGGGDRASPKVKGIRTSRWKFNMNLGDVDEKYLKRVPIFQYPDHLFFFGARSLEKLLNRTGFEVVELKRYALRPQERFVRAVETLKSGGVVIVVDAEERENEGDFICAAETMTREAGFSRFRMHDFEDPSNLYYEVRP